MDKAARSALIRATHRAKVGLAAYAPSGKPRVRRYVPTLGNFPMYTVGLGNPEIEPQWVKLPDPEVEHPLGERNKQEVSALTRIAEQLPAKLKRMSATGLL